MFFGGDLFFQISEIESHKASSFNSVLMEVEFAPEMKSFQGNHRLDRVAFYIKVF